MRKWMRRKLNKAAAAAATSHENANTMADLPFLASAPALSSARSDSMDLGAVPAGPSANSSPFFHVLPAEVRDQILRYAFGDLTLHMDLSLTRPGPPPAATGHHPPAPSTHAGLHTGIGKDSAVVFEGNKQRREAWRWAGCVCHREMPPHLKSPVDRIRGMAETPAEDGCMVGREHACAHWPGESPRKCRIGIMGWLRSCRAAYLEGIAVLYQTNLIHISSGPLLSHLDRLVPVRHLDEMTGLEIVWPVGLVPKDFTSDTIVPSLSDVESILGILKGNFPALQRLRLAIQVQGGREYEVRIPITAGDGMLALLDQLALSRAQALFARPGNENRINEFQFAVFISTSVHTRIFESALRSKQMSQQSLRATNHSTLGSDEENDESKKFQFVPGEIWRNLEDGMNSNECRYIFTQIAPAPTTNTAPVSVAKRMASSFPRRPSGFGSEGAKQGYWIVEGDKDLDRAGHVAYGGIFS